MGPLSHLSGFVTLVLKRKTLVSGSCVLGMQRSGLCVLVAFWTAFCGELVAFWRPLCSGFCVLVLRSARNRTSGTEMSFRSCVLNLRSVILILRSRDPSAMVSAF